MLVGLGHVDLVCADVERSLAFYASVFGGLGLEAPYEVPGERGETIFYLRFPAAGSGSLGLRQALEEQSFELYAPGLHHLVLAVEGAADVDASHAAAVEAGAEVLHAPRFWPQYHPDYYATFFLDPDGQMQTLRARLEAETSSCVDKLPIPLGGDIVNNRGVPRIVLKRDPSDAILQDEREFGRRG